MMKTCRTCKADKERSEFYYLPAGGREASCKACKIKSVRRYQVEKMADPVYAEKLKELAREKYRAAHPGCQIRRP